MSRRLGKPSPKTGSAMDPVEERVPTLAELGIDKRLADRCIKLAAIPEHKFEAMLAELPERVSRAYDRMLTSIMRRAALEERRQKPEDKLATVPPEPRSARVRAPARRKTAVG